MREKPRTDPEPDCRSPLASESVSLIAESKPYAAIVEFSHRVSRLRPLVGWSGTVGRPCHNVSF